MLPRPPLPPGPYLVVGLARSGVAVAIALRSLGAEVVGVDSGPVSDARRAEFAAAGVPVHSGTPGTELLQGIETVIKSPGVPAQAPVIAAAREAGIGVLGEFELGWRLVPNETIVVTGSNGKTTTVELIGHLHRTAGQPVVVAGNVGTALTSLFGSGLPEAAIVVAEVSSFQLEDTLLLAPDAGVLLNLAEDHLDRHGTFDAYKAAKLAGVRPPAARHRRRRARRSRRRRRGPGRARAVRHGPRRSDGRPRRRPLVGRRAAHRATTSSGCAARTTARTRWPPRRSCSPAAWRATRCARGWRRSPASSTGSRRSPRHDGVLYVNDSKATNVASAIAGIESFEGGLHLILGGSRKAGGYAALAGPVAERARAVYLIGETGPEIGAALAGAGVPLHDSGDLETAVAAARAAARPGEVVLLSPACASFDQYPDYEARGEHFRALVV